MNILIMNVLYIQNPLTTKCESDKCFKNNTLRKLSFVISKV